jgi:hypothetical protein
MTTDYCEHCPDEDTRRCNTCDGHGKDILEEKLAHILDKESERIKNNEK